MLFWVSCAGYNNWVISGARADTAVITYVLTNTSGFSAELFVYADSLQAHYFFSVAEYCFVSVHYDYLSSSGSQFSSPVSITFLWFVVKGQIMKTSMLSYTPGLQGNIVSSLRSTGCVTCIWDQHQYLRSVLGLKVLVSNRPAVYTALSVAWLSTLTYVLKINDYKIWFLELVVNNSHSFKIFFLVVNASTS